MSRLELFPLVQRDIPYPHDWTKDGRRIKTRTYCLPTKPAVKAARAQLEQFLKNRRAGESFRIRNQEISRYYNTSNQLGITTGSRLEGEFGWSRMWILIPFQSVPSVPSVVQPPEVRS